MKANRVVTLRITVQHIKREDFIEPEIAAKIKKIDKDLEKHHKDDNYQLKHGEVVQDDDFDKLNININLDYYDTDINKTIKCDNYDGGAYNQLLTDEVFIIPNAKEDSHICITILQQVTKNMNKPSLNDLNLSVLITCLNSHYLCEGLEPKGYVDVYRGRYKLYNEDIGTLTGYQYTTYICIIVVLIPSTTHRL